ncbi:YceI family protein [Shewanella sp. WXL01]|uniref:YceI family protein n=1 Tax=Shewanella maritima TaxID=2520507 RepID=A0A411PD25_9GAMM|nr:MULTISPECIES: YceI family protein [Shewanella]NKF50545.1 YceI family protein [Shewanella sp. WXL01]QBF81455.1 YceI family protein [Shewanella maritima]
MKTQLKCLSVVALSAFFSASALAGDWQVNSANSNVSFISTKKQDIAEVHHFKNLSGSLSESGEFSLTIPLKSVATGIEIRDQRMQSMLFEVSKYPSMMLSAEVKPELYKSLAVGHSVIAQVNGTIDLHGIKADKVFDVMVAKVAKEKLLVTSFKPVVVNAKDFGLEGGVEKLREVAGLSSISLAVPVSFVISLSQ